MIAEAIPTYLIGNLFLTHEGIHKDIHELNVNKCPDLILIFTPLVQCIDQVTAPLYLVYLTPIYKSGNRWSVKNYRCVNILATIPKLFETLICDKLPSVIYPQKLGKGRSTSTSYSLLVSNVLCKSEE